MRFPPRRPRPCRDDPRDCDRLSDGKVHAGQGRWWGEQRSVPVLNLRVASLPPIAGETGKTESDKRKSSGLRNPFDGVAAVGSASMMRRVGDAKAPAPPSNMFWYEPDSTNMPAPPGRKTAWSDMNVNTSTSGIVVLSTMNWSLTGPPKASRMFVMRSQLTVGGQPNYFAKNRCRSDIQWRRAAPRRRQRRTSLRRSTGTVVARPRGLRDGRTG
jgi:hypothetical protein